MINAQYVPTNDIRRGGPFRNIHLPSSSRVKSLRSDDDGPRQERRCETVLGATASRRLALDVMGVLDSFLRRAVWIACQQAWTWAVRSAWDNGEHTDTLRMPVWLTASFRSCWSSPTWTGALNSFIRFIDGREYSFEQSRTRNFNGTVSCLISDRRLFSFMILLPAKSSHFSSTLEKASPPPLRADQGLCR